ncbi:MAG: hypothetical protein IKS09_05885 [Lachnospiraceae bacterium]|nr:hypothetical protein [Lachnospiraceae bacterium]
MKEKLTTKNILLTLVLILVAILSFGRLSGWASSVKTQEHNIVETDKKIDTAKALAAGSVAMSAGLSLLPGDALTPIAEELAELTKYFLIILSVLFLEKYIITIAGIIAFRILIPLACLFVIIFIYTKKEELLKLAGKLAVFALALFLAIPVSIGISDLIYNIKAESVEVAVKQSEEIEKSDNEDANWIERLTGALNDTAKYAGNYLNNLLESLAVMLVTTCVIPLLVALFFVWLVRTLFKSDLIKWGKFSLKRNNDEEK